MVKAIRTVEPMIGTGDKGVEPAEEEMYHFGRRGVQAIRDIAKGERLHEEPAIPCFWETDEESGELIKEGAVLAIEVIYTMGRPDLVLSADDNWTISTKDGKISGLFEETVAVEKNGPVVLTA